MTEAASWPDPDRPGVPLHPERDGWHWLRHPDNRWPRPLKWDAGRAMWCGYYSMISPRTATDFGYHYDGICPLPSEVAAREAAAERRGMERERARYADLMTALAGLMRGEDWNHGTHAQRHGYRAAVMRAYAAICAPAEGETP